MKDTREVSESQTPIGIHSAGISAKWQLFLWRLLSFLIVFSIWEIAGRSDISIAFPPFSDVAIAFISMALSG